MAKKITSEDGEASVIQLTPGRVSKGGTNPPNTSSARPPAPGGSGGNVIKLIDGQADQIGPRLANTPDTSPPVVSIPVATLNTRNNAQISRIMRRLRELVVECQQHQGTGRIILDVHAEDGTLVGNARVHPDWIEKLTG